MINNISFLNLRRNTLSLNKTNSNNQTNSISYSGSSLKPLAYDTVSFGAKHKTETELEIMMQAIHNDEICEQLHEDAQETKNYMEGIVKKHFGNFVFNRESNVNGIIEPIQGRVKSPGSIKEKTLKRFIRSIEVEKDEFGNARPTVTTFSPYNKDSIKKNIKDVPGRSTPRRRNSSFTRPGP